jgi:Protein of unknown function (DUF3046)
VRHSDFWRLVDEEFGAGYGRTLVRDQVLSGAGHRTGDQALAAGMEPRAVWRALCEEMDVPEARRLGREPAEPAGGRPPRRPRRRA